MNLANNPTRDELRDLFAACDDNAAHHILWVGHDGEVHIDPCPTDKTPAAFAKEHKDEIKVRHETFNRGNEYVGPDAAKDTAHVDRNFNELVYQWKKGFTGYSDYWQAPNDPAKIP